VIGLRTGFYVLYVVLGALIFIRMLSFGIRVETITGLVLGALLVALGLYRLVQVGRVRRARR